MKVSAIQKKIFPSSPAVPFANTTLAHLPYSITLHNLNSYNALIFTIKNYSRNKLPYEKIDNNFSATAYNKE